MSADDDAPYDDVPGPAKPHRFRHWRRSRPFWGGLLTILGGAEIAALPLTAYKIILVSTSVVLAAVVGLIILILGVLTWMTPSQNKLYGLLTALLGVVSFVTSNVGGFVLGGLLTIIGGALTFAWVVVTPGPQAVVPLAPADGDAAPAPQPAHDSGRGGGAGGEGAGGLNTWWPEGEQS